MCRFAAGEESQLFMWQLWLASVCLFLVAKLHFRFNVDAMLEPLQFLSDFKHVQTVSIFREQLISFA